MLKKKLGFFLIYISVIASLAIVLGFSSFSYAAYRNSLKAQRAIAPYDVIGVRFSSNYLNTDDRNYKTIYSTSALVPSKTSVTVCNYAQGKHTLYYNSTISYSISLTLLKSDYTEASSSDVGENETISFGDYTLGKTDPEDSNVCVLSQTINNCSLPGGKTSSDSYLLVFNKPDSSLHLKVEVTPNHDLPVLRATFSTIIRAEDTTRNWLGSFSDDTNKTTSSYDGFNYLINGSGSGTCKLYWNHEILDLSFQSITQFDFGIVTVDSENTDWSYVTFDVDSNNISRYDIQFYIVDITGTSWSSSQMIDSNEDLVVRLEFS